MVCLWYKARWYWLPETGAPHSLRLVSCIVSSTCFGGCFWVRLWIHHEGWTLLGTSDCLNRSIYGQMVNDDSRLSSTVLSWRGGRARDTPFSFQRVADPGCRPHMVFLEVTQELYYLVSFFRVAYKRSPYEDGMADGNRQWNSFRRTITGSADGACMR